VIPNPGKQSTHAETRRRREKRRRNGAAAAFFLPLFSLRVSASLREAYSF
jgi:hypothetical protein